MYEYHGWITIGETAGERDVGGLHQAVAQIRNYLSESVAVYVAGLDVVNGLYVLWLAGHPNHKTDIPLRLFEYVASQAPGSYGLLYIRDDDDQACPNAFQVWRLARGRLESAADPFLSPCVPIIEDRFTEDTVGE